VEAHISTAFASFDTEGAPDPNASVRIYVNGSTNFGNITFRYFNFFLTPSRKVPRDGVFAENQRVFIIFQQRNGHGFWFFSQLCQ